MAAVVLEPKKTKSITVSIVSHLFAMKWCLVSKSNTAHLKLNTSFTFSQTCFWGFPGGSVVKNLPANARDGSSIPDLGRCPGEGNGNLLQYSCLRSSMDRGTWWATVHEVAKSRTWLSDWMTTTKHVSFSKSITHTTYWMHFWNPVLKLPRIQYLFTTSTALIKAITISLLGYCRLLCYNSFLTGSLHSLLYIIKSNLVKNTVSCYTSAQNCPVTSHLLE